MNELRDNWKSMLAVRPVCNRAVRTEAVNGVTRLHIRKRRPRYLVPPLSWLIRPRLESTIELDRLGGEVLNLCDDERTVEAIIERFAERHQLTFHEARVSVTNYLRALVERGIIVLVETGLQTRDQS
ncbi:MAG: PqqD family protein [Lentisphaeria bacterium]|jgi:hypothetical protein|nr:PqqD family protein [Lentisphaeria bacterium]